ncbi:MAG: C40 family peptidase [Lachnospiraceae bacterium]|nr:C40 family peptidase [Lachnospiraceae bacterium]
MKGLKVKVLSCAVVIATVMSMGGTIALHNQEGKTKEGLLLTSGVSTTLSNSLICKEDGNLLQAGISSDLASKIAANIDTSFDYSLNAGISDSLSEALMTASIKENDVTLTSTSAKADVDSKYIGTNKKGNTTVCGYEKLGIVHVDGNLNIRKTSSKKGKIIGKVTNKAGCEIIKQDGDWTKISSGKVTGWIDSEYLLTGEDALDKVDECAVCVAKSTTNNLRVRSDASTNAKILTTIAKNEKVEVVEEGEDWIKVDVNGDEGYISADYADTKYELDTASSLAQLQSGEGTSDTRVSLVQYALSFVGGRYVWGGTSLTNGVDCSGFTMRIYQKYGVSLPHYSGAQASGGSSISSSEARPGDLFFYGSGGHISHVAIYIGNGQIVHASNSRTGIIVSNAFYRDPIKVVRYLN